MKTSFRKLTFIFLFHTFAPNVIRCKDFYIERDSKRHFRCDISSLIDARADDCSWPVTVLDVAVSVPPTVVRITSAVSEARSTVWSVSLSVGAAPAVTNTAERVSGKHLPQSDEEMDGRRPHLRGKREFRLFPDNRSIGVSCETQNV